MADLTEYNKLREHYGLPAMQVDANNKASPIGGWGETPGFVTDQNTGMKSPVLSTPNSQGVSTYTDPSGRTRSTFTGLSTGADGRPIGTMPYGASDPPPVSGDMQWVKTDLGYELRPNENYYRTFGYGQGGTPADYHTGAFSSYYSDNPIFKPQTQNIPAGGVPTPPGGTGGGPGAAGPPRTDGEDSYEWPDQPYDPSAGVPEGPGYPRDPVSPVDPTAPVIPTPYGSSGGGMMQASLGEVASYNPYTSQVEYNELVKNQMAEAMETPYAQLARKKALEQMNERGLLNSSLAQGAATRAAIEASLPVAQQDAATYAETRFRGNDAINRALETNTGARNDMTRANMDALNAFGLDSQQFQQQMALTGTEHGQQQWLAQFDRNTREKLTDMAAQSDEFLTQMKLTQQNKEFIADKLNDNNHWVLAAVTEIQKMEDLSQDQRNILLEEVGVIHKANLQLLTDMNLVSINWTGIAPPAEEGEEGEEGANANNETPPPPTGANRDTFADESMYT